MSSHTAKYDENRDKSITAQKNISNLGDLAPRSPFEEKTDVAEIISFNKAKTETAKSEIKKRRVGQQMVGRTKYAIPSIDTLK